MSEDGRPLKVTMMCKMITHQRKMNVKMCKLVVHAGELGYM